jgi:hypothetical protein
MAMLGNGGRHKIFLFINIVGVKLGLWCARSYNALEDSREDPSEMLKALSEADTLLIAGTLFRP